MMEVSLNEVAEYKHRPQERIDLARRHLKSRFPFEPVIDDDQVLFGHLLGYMSQGSHGKEEIMRLAAEDYAAWKATDTPPHYVDSYYVYMQGDLHKIS